MENEIIENSDEIDTAEEDIENDEEMVDETEET